MANLQVHVYQRFRGKKGADHQLVSQRLTELKSFIKEVGIHVTTLLLKRCYDI